MESDYDLHRIMDHASMKHFAGTLRAFILEVFMFLALVTARTVVIISRTHLLTSTPWFLPRLAVSTVLAVSFPIFCEAHVR